MEQTGLLTRQEQEEKFLACCVYTENFQDKIRGIRSASNYFSKAAYSEFFKVLLKMQTGLNMNLDLLRDKMKAANLNMLEFNNVLFADGNEVHLKYYHKAIKEAYLRQKTKDLVNYTNKILETGEPAINDVLDGLSKNLSLLQEKTTESRTYHIAECLSGGIDIVNSKLFADNGIIGLASGIDAYDRLTRGFQGGRLYIIGARPSYGKSTLGINLAGQIGMHTPTLFFTLEMTKESLAAKLIQIKGRIDYYERDSNKKDEAVVRSADAVEELERSNIYINDSSYQTKDTFTAEVKKLHRENKCKFVVLDYIGLVSGRRRQKEQDKLSEFSRACKILAGDLNIPIVILTQLNRDIEKDGNRKPRKSDIRTSGSLEQDADAITFIHNLKPTEPNNTEFVLVHDKERDGRTGDIPVKFEKKYQIFEESSWSNDD